MARSTSFQSALSRAPLIRIALPFIAGLVIGRQWPLAALPLGTGALLSGVIWYLWTARLRDYSRRWSNGAGAFAVFLGCGLFWQSLHSPAEQNKDLARRRGTAWGWQVRISEVIGSSDRVFRAWATVTAVIDSVDGHRARGRLLVTLMKDSSVADPGPGDEVLLLARVDTLHRTVEPGGFDQRAWAASYGVLHACFTPAGSWRITHRAQGFASWFEGARRRIIDWLGRTDLDARERGLVKAILLGIRDELDADQKSAFARSGTMHVLAVSGSHVALIYGVLLWSFRRLGEQRRWRILRSVVMLVVLWGYAGLTGATPSVLRATLTFTLFCLADMWRRQPDPVNSLAAAAVLLLAMDPLMLGQLSFQLSFLAVMGIALFYRPLMHLWAPPNRVLYYFWSLFSVSIAAQAFTTPLALYAFGAFPAWFLPANLVIVGCVALGVYGGAALLVLMWFPVLGDAATGFMTALLWCITFASDFFANLPGAYPAVRVDGWQCVGLYLLVLLLAGWLLERWGWARMGALSVTIALLASWAWSAHQRNERVRLVIYDERDGLTSAVERGRSLTVFTDTLDQWNARKIDRHQRAIGAYEVETHMALPARISVGATSIGFIAPGSPHPILPAPAIMVLKEDGRYDMDGIIGTGAPKTELVLASTISAKRRAWLRRWSEEHGIRVHDIREQGAYVREL